MTPFHLVLLTAALACAASARASDIAPGGTLRAAYLGTNPAQAMRDPAARQILDRRRPRDCGNAQPADIADSPRRAAQCPQVQY